MKDEFLLYLGGCGVSLEELSRKESFAVTKRWTSVFARGGEGVVEVCGARAVGEWLGCAGGGLIMLFLSSGIAAFPVSRNSRACSAFRYCGPVVDLSDYHELEFAVFPGSYEWTLVHTHEDFAMGGLIFCGVWVSVVCRQGVARRGGWRVGSDWGAGVCGVLTCWGVWV